MNIFAKAADVLMEKGHAKGTLRNKAGAVCAVGALCEADSSDVLDDACDAAGRAEQHLGLPKAPLDGSLRPLAKWNDAPERTAEDVILLFKTLAAEEES